MTCTCLRDSNGELLPTGCIEHSEPYENIPGRFKLQEEGAIGPLTPKELWVGWVSLACVAIVAGLIYVIWRHS
jgi:hypothetical protein